jgi:hypothetical protein
MAELSVMTFWFRGGFFLTDIASVALIAAAVHPGSAHQSQQSGASKMNRTKTVTYCYHGVVALGSGR